MRQTWSITISGLNDAQAAQEALFALEGAGFSTGVHLSAIIPYAGNETTIYHWCDHARACATADRLAKAGLDARVTENLPGLRDRRAHRGGQHRQRRQAAGASR